MQSHHPQHKAIVTCALNGVLTNPETHPVPVTPEQMAAAAAEAYDAGASIVHCHFRRQEPGKGALPSWDPEVVEACCRAIKARVPEIIINMSTGIPGADISGPLACLERVKPEMAAMNAGSLNYLKTRSDGSWAWKPMLFDNPIEKIEAFLKVMHAIGIVPECECFDTGIVRSLGMFLANGMLKAPLHASLVMGVASGMPAKPEWLPLLLAELPPQTHWQVIAIGREQIWELHRRCAELGGHVRTGLEDTFYLPDGSKTQSNGVLIEALVKVVEASGRQIASPAETRQMLGIK
ncbi:MAG: 3-keto-5-aminohexanoate cleavage protein [Candidatus Melainabacteria bacterium HGW-Melainabacteria-1]|nr:MAG: 3-keto-5-aminohexanoate cleavage protein [Candidatus Melainabacteria bacterium HGW-Melainabacteria-1]